jgi:tryptophan-rich sensory protein
MAEPSEARGATTRSPFTWLAATFAAGLLGAPFVDRRWYRALAKPAWAPSPGVFGPVWTTLYALIALAGWLATDRGRRVDGSLLRPFAAQLALNAVWTPLFFGLRRPFIALVEILVLDAAVAWTTVRFWQRRTVAGALLLPYLAWIAFATGLTAAIWRRNR